MYKDKLPIGVLKERSILPMAKAIPIIDIPGIHGIYAG
jgi:hypothetical protein